MEQGNPIYYFDNRHKIKTDYLILSSKKWDFQIWIIFIQMRFFINNWPLNMSLKLRLRYLKHLVMFFLFLRFSVGFVTVSRCLTLV